MGVEIEAKMALPDLAGMQAQLKSVGADLVKTVLETNTFFDDGKRSLKSSDQGLRIRVEEDAQGQRSARLTHKGPRAHGRLKSRSEHETVVDDPRQLAEVLAGLGYFPTLTFQKVRRHWRLNDCWVELDTLPHLGDFIEIEGPSEDAVMQTREALGLGGTPLIRASYSAMLDDHQNQHRVTSNVIRFETQPTLS